MLRSILQISRSSARHGLRQYCGATANDLVKSPVLVDSGKIQFQDVSKISETDLETIFDYSAEGINLDENWEEAMEVIKKSEDLCPPERPTEEDLLSIRATRPTMTLASLVTESKTLQMLVDLGVSLHMWETMGHIGLAVKLDFDRDVAHIVRFLADVGVPHDRIGSLLSYNPLILEEEEDDLKTRINYLRSKKFSDLEIAILITVASNWLSFPVKLIDTRMGFFQKTFGLTGSEVRQFAVTVPSLITWAGTPIKVRKNIFSLNEEMGFTKEELKLMVMENPQILKHSDELVLKSFEVLHNVAKIPHDLLARFPVSLMRPWNRILERHKYLESLGRAQYCPNLPNYVSPVALADGEDKDFSENVARTPVTLFNKFMKTL